VRQLSSTLFAGHADVLRDVLWVGAEFDTPATKGFVDQAENTRHSVARKGNMKAKSKTKYEMRGARLFQEALEQRKISQAECARLMTVDRARLHRIYHGQCTPTIREAVLLNRLLDVPIIAWFCDDDTGALCL
jgi:ribosome-binding protein aMBF1 (putative translation factor)